VYAYRKGHLVGVYTSVEAAPDLDGGTTSEYRVFA
jgi:hypothetical protein